MKENMSFTVLYGILFSYQPLMLMVECQNMVTVHVKTSFHPHFTLYPYIDISLITSVYPDHIY